VRDNEEEVEKGQMEIDGATFPSPLPPYIPPKKPYEKLVKESKDAKYDIFTTLMLESMLFNGETLGMILQLKFTDYDFNDRKKYP